MTEHPAKFLAKYAKQYNAGAFATPLPKELDAHPEWVTDEQHGDHRTVIVAKVQGRSTGRADFTGTKFTLPVGARVATHVARTPGAPIPRMERHADYVMSYPEDHELRDALTRQGFAPVAHRVTAAAEVITVWGPKGAPAILYPDHERATVTTVPVNVPERLRARIRSEVDSVQRWADDFPYYSDGSWTSVSLKGFWPRDPSRGVKPSEMPKSWKAEHPRDLERRCEWTTLANDCPTVTRLVKAVPWWRQTERVRLLKMEGGGKLGRHSDITDRDGGTRDGQIVRFHIPLVTHPDIRMTVWELDGNAHQHHLAEWGCYYLDARKPHSVHNPTDLTRIHLVADVVCDAEVRRVLAESYRGARA